MITKDEALMLAMEAMEITGGFDVEINAIKEALAQPEQEPAALVEKFSLLLWDYQELERAFEKATGGKWIRKSNTPQPEPVIDKSAAVRIATALGWEPKRTWVGLLDEELAEFSEVKLGAYDLCLEVEAKLKEKNT